MITFQFFLQVVQCVEAVAFELRDPACVNLVQRHRVKVVQFFAALPDNRDQVCFFHQLQVLCHGLAAHVHMFAKCPQRLAIILVQQVKQAPSARVSQCFEYFVDVQKLRQFQLSILMSSGLGAPFPVSTSDFKLIRKIAHLVLQ